MSEKILNARYQQKYDIEANWMKAVNFIPKAGEVIVYTGETISDALPPWRSYRIKETRIKVGDGVNNVNDLDFIFSESVGAIFLALDKIHKIQNSLIDSVESSGGDMDNENLRPVANYSGADLDVQQDQSATIAFSGIDLDEEDVA